VKHKYDALLQTIAFWELKLAELKDPKRFIHGANHFSTRKLTCSQER
jgi:hypothetical protein